MSPFPLDYTRRHIFKLEAILRHIQAYKPTEAETPFLARGAYQGI